MWTCPECKREFIKVNQSHSCGVFPLENHFAGKEEVGKPLFDEFVARVRAEVGPVRIDSPACCIHLVKNSTFAAAWVRKDRIKIDFRLERKIDSPRFTKTVQLSAKRYVYYMDIMSPDNMDAELMGWLKESYNLM